MGAAHDRRDVRDEGGFTLVELLVVIAIIAVLIPLLLPVLLFARADANHAAASATLTAVATAQDRHREAHGRWAASSAELLRSSPELHDALSDGEDGGYRYELRAIEPDGWTARATPAAPGISGRTTFVVDATGVVRELRCPPGRVWDPRSGECVPDPSAAILDGAAGTIAALDRFGFGLAVRGAAELVADDGFVTRVGELVDADDDGLVTVEEVLDADPFAMARDLVGAPDDRRELIDGEDGARRAWTAHHRWLTDLLQLGVADEGPPPGVPIPRPDGSSTALLDRVPEVTTAQSLGFLRSHIASLDVRADPLGDMAHRDDEVNAKRQRVLLREVERMARSFERGQDQALTAHLLRTRGRADGDPEDEDWIVGPAADRIVAQIDLTLESRDG